LGFNGKLSLTWGETHVIKKTKKTTDNHLSPLGTGCTYFAPSFSIKSRYMVGVLV